MQFNLQNGANHTLELESLHLFPGAAAAPARVAAEINAVNIR